MAWRKNGEKKSKKKQYEKSEEWKKKETKKQKLFRHNIMSDVGPLLLFFSAAFVCDISTDGLVQCGIHATDKRTAQYVLL